MASNTVRHRDAASETTSKMEITARQHILVRRFLYWTASAFGVLALDRAMNWHWEAFIALGLIAAATAIAAYKWPNWAPKDPRFVGSAIKVATDFRWWLAVLFLAVAIASVPSMASLLYESAHKSDWQAKIRSLEAKRAHLQGESDYRYSVIWGRDGTAGLMARDTWLIGRNNELALALAQAQAQLSGNGSCVSAEGKVKLRIGTSECNGMPNGLKFGNGVDVNIDRSRVVGQSSPAFDFSDGVDVKISDTHCVDWDGTCMKVKDVRGLNVSRSITERSHGKK